MPNSKILIAPSILSADFSDLKGEIKKVEEAGADWIHVDVMDGQFVPNITIGAPVVKCIRKITKLPLDVHLMIVDPDKHIKDFVSAGANVVTVHAEACTHLQRTLSYIKELGCKAGISFNPHTPVDKLKYVLEIVDLVLIMTVNPGFGGQSFISSVVPKISEVKKMFSEANLSDKYIEVDGGINTNTAPIVRSAGANVLVAGNAIYSLKSQTEIQKTISQMRA
ncbi:MAG: ribulose-phosphate 3-epimerase [Candidatus Melainabacteria bacterium]|nr:ribulose-phosphate 3-epimerase [Candidatus Melainabacteria bacterium]